MIIDSSERSLAGGVKGNEFSVSVILHLNRKLLSQSGLGR